MRKLKIGDIVYITSDPVKSKNFGKDSRWFINNRKKLVITKTTGEGRFTLAPLVPTDKANVSYCHYKEEWLELATKKPILILED